MVSSLAKICVFFKEFRYTIFFDRNRNFIDQTSTKNHKTNNKRNLLYINEISFHNRQNCCLLKKHVDHLKIVNHYL